MRNNHNLAIIICSVLVFSGCSVDEAYQGGQTCNVPGTQAGYQCKPDEYCNTSDGDPKCEKVGDKCEDANNEFGNYNGYCRQNALCVEGRCVSATLCGTDKCDDSKYVCCKEKCIDPLTDVEYCGAAVGGSCTDENPESRDYRGTNCGSANCHKGYCVVPITLEVVDNDFTVNEERKAVQIKAVLEFQPSSEVYLKFVTNRPDESVLACGEMTEDNVNVGSECTLVFDPGNYAIQQSVSVIGKPDNVHDGDQKFEVTAISRSQDRAFDGVQSVPLECINLDMDHPGISFDVAEKFDDFVFEGEENNGTQLSVRLKSKPRNSAKVTLLFESKDNTELQLVGDTTLLFTEDNWNIPQKVLVQSVTDNIVDGNQMTEVLLTSYCDKDKDYDGIMTGVYIESRDIDSARMLITCDDDCFSLNENDATYHKFNVRLSSKPSKTVYIDVTSSAPDSLEVSVNSSILIFEPEDWNQPQTVFFRTIDNDALDATRTAHISFITESKDSVYDKLEAESPEIKILDDDKAGIILSYYDGQRLIGNGSVYAYIALTKMPDDDVFVEMKFTDKCLSMYPEELQFTKDNYNVPQYVVFSANGCSDAYRKSEAYAQAMNKSPSTTYRASVESDHIQIERYAFLKKNFSYTGNTVVFDLPSGRYEMKVWGASGGGNYSLDDDFHAGRGGFTVAQFSIVNETKAYINVGQMGSQTTEMSFNGGGGASHYKAWFFFECTGYSGGGGTDIRIGSNSLDSRIIVAGGGGGTAGAHMKVGSYRSSGGYGGGVAGESVDSVQGGTADSGNKPGIGQTAPSDKIANQCSGGGGGGWYGGNASTGAYCTGGAGGSGYFRSAGVAKIISGTGKTYSGNGDPFESRYGLGLTEPGHWGNGYASIKVCGNSEDCPRDY